MEKAIQSVGKRKSAIARAFFAPRTGDTGMIRINHRGFENYFPNPIQRTVVLQPLELTAMTGRYDIQLNLNGGGYSAQASAARHAIARALLKVDPALRPALKKAGFLTRDSREVERKKYGQAGARKRFQFSKR